MLLRTAPLCCSGGVTSGDQLRVSSWLTCWIRRLLPLARAGPRQVKLGAGTPSYPWQRRSSHAPASTRTTPAPSTTSPPRMVSPAWARAASSRLTKCLLARKVSLSFTRHIQRPLSPRPACH